MVVNTLEEMAGFARNFVNERAQGSVVGLIGNLGAGKTTFVRHVIKEIAKGQGVSCPSVTSPSFVLHQRYDEIQPSVDHFDLYRLENATERQLEDLGYFEAVQLAKQGNGFLFVEWPEKAERMSLLECDEFLSIELKPEGSRAISIKSGKED